MRSTDQVHVSPRTATGQPSYSDGIVKDVTGNIATVNLGSGKQIRVRVDTMYGRTAPAREGEKWMLTQEFGVWHFVACMAMVPVEVRKFAQTIGDGTMTNWIITHSLDTLDVVVQVVDPTSGLALAPTVTLLDENHVQLTFTSPPATGHARVVVIG